MNLPIQAPPVMRGQDRAAHPLPVPNPTATQSQLFGGSLSALCAACAIAPPPYSIICSIFCPLVFGRAR
jgi:hypothetical protein